MLRTFALLLAFALILSSAPAVRAADAPYPIDVILTLTGPGTFIGQADKTTLEAVETLVNKQGGIHGRPVHFVFHDDQTDPQIAIQLANDILARRAPVFLGSSNAAACGAIAPLVANGPVDYCLSPAVHPAKDSYVFSTSYSTRDMAIALTRFFRERGWKRIALITSTDAVGQDGDNQFAAALDAPENKDAGMTFVAREHFNVADIGVTAQMTRIKAANPDVVVAWSIGTPFGTLLRGFAQSGMTIPVATGNGNMTYAQMKQYAAFLPKALYFPGLPYLAHEAPSRKAAQIQRDFLDAFRPLGITPDFIYSTAWDPAFVVVDALRALGTDATPARIRSYIEGLHGFTGIAGEYDFRDGSQRGLAERNVMIMRWDANQGTWTTK